MSESAHSVNLKYKKIKAAIIWLALSVNMNGAGDAELLIMAI